MQNRRVPHPRSPLAVAHWKNYYKSTPYRSTERERRYVALIQKHGHVEGSVLDVACGSGQLLLALKRKGFVAFGVDINADHFCLDLTKTEGVYVVQAAALSLPFRTRSFDVICSVGFLEHMDRLEITAFFAESARVLHPEGLILIHVPVRSPASVVSRFIRKHIARDIESHSIDDDNDPTHKIWLNNSEWKDIFTASDLKIIETGYHLRRSSGTPRYIFAIIEPIDRFSEWVSENPIRFISIIGIKLRSYFSFSSYFVLSW